MSNLIKLTLTAIIFLSLNTYSKTIAVHCNGEEITAENPILENELLCNKKNGIPILNKEQAKLIKKVSGPMAEIISNREVAYLNHISLLTDESGNKLAKELKVCKPIAKSIAKCKTEKADKQMVCIMKKAADQFECLDNAITNWSDFERSDLEFNLKTVCDMMQTVSLASLIPADGIQTKKPNEIIAFADKNYSNCLKLTNEEKAQLAMLLSSIQ